MNSKAFASRLKNVRAMLEQIRAMNNPEVIKRAEYLMKQENTSLEQEIETAKEELCTLEMQLGTKRDQAVAKPEGCSNSKPQKSGREKAFVKNEKSGASDTVEVGRLDFRVGRIVEVYKHPDADSLYVEKVDLGEGRLRTVVSGLVKFVPIEEMHNLVGVFLCNLKPAKMRGVESEAMVMCASAPEAGGVEPLRIECYDVQIGEAVIVPGYDGTPDAQLNPKKKIFETVKPFLRVDQSGLATYKGVPWTLRRTPTAVVCAPMLRDVQIS